MKTFLNLKRIYLKLFIVFILLPFFGGTGGGLYAQDPQLFEHTWYFVNGEFDGEIFQAPTNVDGTLDFFSDFFVIFHSFCEEGIEVNILYDINQDEFLLDDQVFVVLVGICSDTEQTDFMHKHYSIYGDYQNTGEANNPFNYTIESINDYLQLTITNGEGDWAVYNSVLLSTPTFDQKRFTMYPNPVKENLNIQTTSNQSASATIYDVSGKLIHKQFLEENNSSINVKAFNTGLYFVVFENERGERVSKKFVKN